MATDYWIKLYIEILDDPKMATLPDRTWRRVVELFLLAGRLSYKTGQLPDTKQIAWSLRISEDEAKKDLEAIERIGIIRRNNGGWIVVNFEDRQDASTPTERWQAHRDRKRKEEYYQHEANDIQTNSLTDTESESDTESEQSIAKKPPENSKPNILHSQIYDLAKALAEVTGIDLQVNQRKLMDSARDLMQNPKVNPAIIRQDYGAGGDWYKKDWRGKKSQRPSLANVKETLFNLRGGKPKEPQMTQEEIKQMARELKAEQDAMKKEEATI